MPNVPGRDPKPFQRGEALTARHLNQVLSALVRRIVGGTGILVKQTGQGSNVVISSTAGPPRSPASVAEVAKETVGQITSAVGSGRYTFKVTDFNATATDPDGSENQVKLVGGQYFIYDSTGTTQLAGPYATEALATADKKLYILCRDLLNRSGIPLDNTIRAIFVKVENEWYFQWSREPQTGTITGYDAATDIYTCDIGNAVGVQAIRSLGGIGIITAPVGIGAVFFPFSHPTTASQRWRFAYFADSILGTISSHAGSNIYNVTSTRFNGTKTAHNLNQGAVVPTGTSIVLHHPGTGVDFYFNHYIPPT